MHFGLKTENNQISENLLVKIWYGNQGGSKYNEADECAHRVVLNYKMFSYFSEEVSSISIPGYHREELYTLNWI